MSRAAPPAALFVGAVTGSAAGTLLWWHSGSGYNTSEAEALFSLWALTACGSALGAWALRDGADTSFGRLLAGASVGVITGAVVAFASARVADRASSRHVASALIVGYSVGQGLFTTLGGL